jgi:hypothetical protein
MVGYCLEESPAQQLTYESDICNKELSRLDYEANCYSRESQIKLDAKRKKRRMCPDKHRQSHEQAKDE